MASKSATKCPISREQFGAAQPIVIGIGDETKGQPCQPRDFSSGSFGFGRYGRVPTPDTASVVVTVGGEVFIASRRDFSTGKAGHWAQGKVEMTIAGTPVRFQVGITMVELGTGESQCSVNVTAVGSKPQAK